MSTEPPARRFRVRPWTVIVIVNLLGVAAFAGIHSFRSARARANLRACYANQRSIAGTLEMYALDHKLDSKTFVLDAAFHETLKKNGYYRTDREDPGGGPRSHLNYVVDPSAPHGIKCVVHGPVPPRAK